jgi:hypothetical protein
MGGLLGIGILCIGIRMADGGYGPIGAGATDWLIMAAGLMCDGP